MKLDGGDGQSDFASKSDGSRPIGGMFDNLIAYLTKIDINCLLQGIMQSPIDNGVDFAG